ncbi:MAG: LysR family transcriptional regulator [Pseudomonadota bacterium]
MDVLNAMRVFVTIVDAGSLTGAADSLDRSQPSVVRSLASLEKHLGTRLLARTTRRMSLTPEGRDFLARCRQILADVAEAEGAVSQQDAELRGVLRLTAPVQFGQRHVAPIVSRFLATYPELEVDLLLLDRNIDLVEEGIDLALRIGPLPDSNLVAVPVGTVRRIICAAPALLSRVAEPSSPAELAGLPCIRITNLTRPGTWPYRDKNRDRTVQVQGRFQCNQVGAGLAACLAGVGFGQFLSYQVRDLIAVGELQPVLEAFEVAPLPVSLVYAGGRLASARQRALVQFVKEALSESEAL